MRHHAAIVRAQSDGERTDLAALCTSSPTSPIHSRSEPTDSLLSQPNSAIGGTERGVYLIIGDLGSNSGQGLVLINSTTFWERFYTMYDSGSSTFGIARTPFTDVQLN